MNNTKIGHFSPTVFWPATIILALTVGITALFPESTNAFFSHLQSELMASVGWFYVLCVAIIFSSIVYFALSQHGHIKLGPDHAQPDYSMPSWFAMLFSAGIGIGLLFFGVAEPVMHYLSPPTGDQETISAAREAMNITFFHWGLNAWAIYALVGLALAYYGYRHKRPLTLRSALHPILGERINGPLGDSVDVFAIIGTILGVATSLGFGVAQINAGLGYLFGLEQAIEYQVVIIVIVTAAATLSVVSGLDKGVKRLSEANMILACSLMLFILLAGPTYTLLQTLLQNTGNYLSSFIHKTLNLYAYAPTDWFTNWTLFYWGWWISWSPFVGMFIARISRGRTIREFLLGVIFVPTGFTFAWMTVFGNSALSLIRDGQSDLADQVIANNAVALFQFLEFYPASSLISGIAVLMIIIFFVTSADSGALVVNMLSSNGNDNTPIWQRVYWSSAIGIVGAVLLLAGGLSALQTATIISALPFAIIILLMLASLFKSLKIEQVKRMSLTNPMNTAPMEHPSQSTWEERLDNIADLPKAKKVEAFIQSTARSAMKSVSEAMSERGLTTSLSYDEAWCELHIRHGEEIDFIYQIKLRRMDSPSFKLSKNQSPNSVYFRADVYLREGGQEYDVMGYSETQIINDILDQYEKHRQFLDVIR